MLTGLDYMPGQIIPKSIVTRRPSAGSVGASGKMYYTAVNKETNLYGIVDKDYTVIIPFIFKKINDAASSIEREHPSCWVEFETGRIRIFINQNMDVEIEGGLDALRKFSTKDAELLEAYDKAGVFRRFW